MTETPANVEQFPETNEETVNEEVVEETTTAELQIEDAPVDNKDKEILDNIMKRRDEIQFAIDKLLEDNSDLNYAIVTFNHGAHGGDAKISDLVYSCRALDRERTHEVVRYNWLMRAGVSITNAALNIVDSIMTRKNIVMLPKENLDMLEKLAKDSIAKVEAVKEVDTQI
jgi:hypothetical protein